MDRGQYEESVSFIKECAKGATVDDGLFSKDNTEIQNYINEKVLKQKLPISAYTSYNSIIIINPERNGQFMKEFRKKLFNVVSLVLAFAMLVTSVHTGASVTQAKQKKNIVILYFSGTGTTRATAQRIKTKTKGKLLEIKASEPYTDDDLDYGNEDSRVTKEHESADSPAESTVRPDISNLNSIKKAVKKSDVVYIGYPIWWGEAP